MASLAEIRAHPAWATMTPEARRSFLEQHYASIDAAGQSELEGLGVGPATTSWKGLAMTAAREGVPGLAREALGYDYKGAAAAAARRGVEGVGELVGVAGKFAQMKSGTDRLAPHLLAVGDKMKRDSKKIATDEQVAAHPIPAFLGYAAPIAGAYAAELGVAGPAGPILHEMTAAAPEQETPPTGLADVGLREYGRAAGRGLAYTAVPVGAGRAFGRTIDNPVGRRAVQGLVSGGLSYAASGDPTISGINALTGALAPRGKMPARAPVRSVDDILAETKQRAGVVPQRAFAEEAATQMGATPEMVAEAAALPKRAGSIGLEKFNGYNTKAAINETVRELRRLDPTRSRVKKWVETDVNARAMVGDYLEDLTRITGRSREEILSGSVSPKALNEDEMRGVVLLVQEATDRSQASIQQYARYRTPEARAAAVRDFELSTAVIDWLDTGLQTSGRAQNIAKMRAVTQGETALRGARATAISKYGDEATIDKVLDIAAGFDSPEAQQNVWRTFTKMKLAGAKTRDAIHLAWLQGLLSGPQTSAMNTGSNAAFQLYEGLGERTVAAAFGALRRGKPGERVYFGEIPAQMMAWRDSFDDALVAASKTFKTGESAFGATKMEVGQALPRELTPITNALTAQDEFFKFMAYRKELYAQGYRDAAAKGVPLTKRWEYARSAAKSGRFTADAIQAARDAAQTLTFTAELGKTGKALQKVAHVEGIRWVVPFFRTLANIQKQAAVRAPIVGLAAPSTWTGIMAGGAARDQALAKLTVSAIGTGMLAWLAPKVADGTFVGAVPTDEGERAQFYRENKIPYSARIGGKYISLGRIEPWGSSIGLAIGLIEGAQKAESNEELAAAFAKSLRDNVLSKTGFSGLSDVLLASQDFEQYGERWVQRLGSSVVPNVVAQVARTQDPTIRDVQSMGAAIEQKVPARVAGIPVFPGYGRENLQPKYNIGGQTESYGDPIGGNLISPIWAKEASNDPVWKELRATETFLTNPSRTYEIRFKSIMNDEDLAQVRSDIKSGRLGPAKTKLLKEALDGKRVEFTPEEYALYTRETGQIAYGYLRQALASPEYQKLDADQRRDEIEKLYRDVHSQYMAARVKPQAIQRLVAEIYQGAP